MARFEAVRTVTLPIAAAIAQHVFVTVDGSSNAVAAADGSDAVGVSLEGATAQEVTDGKASIPVALVQAGGKVKVRVAASTAIAVGANVASGANGEAITAATGDAILGVALEAAGSDADQEVITVLLNKASRQA